MKTLDFVLKKFNIKANTKSPVELPCTREELVSVFKELKYKTGAEIGVDKGNFSKLLCETVPGLKLYSIDPWEVYNDYDEHRRECVEAELHHMGVNAQVARRKLAPYGGCEIIRKFSMDAIKDFAPRSLDFVYIDGNHKFDYISKDINEWSKIVKKGGIVSGHDYKSRRVEIVDVGRAVDLYVKKHNIGKVFRFAKDNDSSWFFINK